MNPISLIPLRDWFYIAAIAAVGVLAAVFIHHEREVGAARAAGQLQHERDAVRAAGAAAAASATTETDRRINAIQEVVHATQVSASAVAADASSARAERDAAVLQLHAYVHRSAVPASAASAVGGAPANDGLLAELLEASWQRNLDLAGEADRRGVAGLACERSYDALTPGARSGAKPWPPTADSAGQEPH